MTIYLIHRFINHCLFFLLPRVLPRNQDMASGYPPEIFDLAPPLKFGDPFI